MAIDQAFATPVNREEESRDYIPTQIIAEMFKAYHYDGIVYKSLLSVDGYNLALFNLEDARLVHCELYKADSIRFSFNAVGKQYYVE